MKRLTSKWALALLMALAGQAGAQTLPYQDPTLPVEERVEDLLKRMTLEEKICQMRHIHRENAFDIQSVNLDKLKDYCQGMSFGFAESLILNSENCADNYRKLQDYMLHETRLGIPVLITTESLHGSVQSGATIYPQNIALGSTFNPELAYQKVSRISGELHTMNIRQVLAPNIDVVRDLRWGRVEESFGEDPYLCSMMGLAEVSGYLDHGISPMVKHYGAHGAPTGGLNLASVSCGVRDVMDIYLKPFETVMKHTGIRTVMSSYNSVNRVPNSASHFLLTEVLRHRWGFRGLVYSDWAAVDMLRNFHYVAEDEESAAIMAVEAGMDVEASSNCFAALVNAVKEGRIDEKKIDQAVRRILWTKMDMGLFEHPYGLSDYALPVHGEEMVQLSKQIADESAVLLKNENHLLPLDVNRLKSIAVIGPNADQVQFGDYSWSKDNKDGISPLEGIRRLAGQKVKVNYAYGCGLADRDASHIEEAVKVAQKSDVVVMCVGTSSTRFIQHSDVPSTCGEGMDLHDISLTGVQHQLIREVHATGRPMVLVLVSGKPMALSWEKAHVPAILVQWYAGEQEGAALADILFGRVNPSGRLNFSFPQSTGHLPAYYNYLPTDKGYYKKPGQYGHPGRDYVFSNPDALWSFGHGLSYTTFDYSRARADRQRYNEGDTIHVSVEVKNSGKREGKEVVQVYVRDKVSSVVMPVKQLKAFRKISLKAGERQTVDLDIPVSELLLTDETGHRFLEPGEIELQVGSASDRIHHRMTVVVGNYAANQHKKAGFTPRQTLKGEMSRVEGIACDVQATPLSQVEVCSAHTGQVLAVTNEKGEYTAQVRSDDTLMFRCEGYETRYAAVDHNKTINIKLSKL